MEWELTNRFLLRPTTVVLRRLRALPWRQWVRIERHQPALERRAVQAVAWNARQWVFLAVHGGSGAVIVGVALGAQAILDPSPWLMALGVMGFGLLGGGIFEPVAKLIRKLSRRTEVTDLQVLRWLGLIYVLLAIAGQGVLFSGLLDNMEWTDGIPLPTAWMEGMWP